MKEHYNDLPDIHSKTVYNFVQSIREEYHIPKPSKSESRLFEKLPEPAFGQEAQVDFGETWLYTKEGKRKKIYFFAMLLSRSRYKFVYLIDKPFTSQIAVAAHHKAFNYFDGIPRKIIYDQDSVFIHNENLGDYLLTKEFSVFCKSQDFKAVFCRKADPQSKGKIESVVKYVKQNFLRGREYINIDLLNTQAIAWLDRTANAKIHASTRLVPKQQWKLEKPHLLPVKQLHVQSELKPYKVRKDHTVLYKTNFYTLPQGTYKSRDSSVLLEIKQKEIFIYTLEKEFICSHILSFEKGQTIRNTDHQRQKSQTLEMYQEQVLELFNKSEIAKNYLQMFRKNKSRYYRDNLQYILKNHDNYDDANIRQSLLFCTENKVYNAKYLIAILNRHKKDNGNFTYVPSDNELNAVQTDAARLLPEYNNIETSDINKYENIFS
ncbi:MAG: transposase family protein [Tenericutes bacterium]|nr:transposase family protein [Mycoplasmatota bacterium]